MKDASDAFSGLDTLCPMHLRLGARGAITHLGPTLRKVLGARAKPGALLTDVFEVKRPRSLSCSSAILGHAGEKLNLRFRDPPRTGLKGILVPLGPQPEQWVLNLSFGISVRDAVRAYRLTNSDFAATDLAIEMLFLIEAQGAAMEASSRLNTRLQGARMAAEEQAFTDTLTGLKNRRALEARLEQLSQGGAPFAVMQIDLDYFKQVNDSLGHAAGDHVLVEVAKIMLSETRSDDLVARLGGDEFTLVLPNVRRKDTLHRIGQRIIEKLEKPIVFEGQPCRISASIGTVWLTSARLPSPDRILSDADLALYASKRAGRAMQTIYSPQLRAPSGRPAEPPAARP